MDVRTCSLHGFRLRVKIIIRPTCRTGDGLRMKTAVARIAEFSGAIVIEQPIFHGGVGAVVGQVKYHAVSRTAVSTVDIRVAITWICGVEEFIQTGITHWQVGRDSRGWLLRPLALANRKLVNPQWYRRAHFHFGDAGSGWGLCSQIAYERL